jgi:hypothetical protein
LCRLIVPSADFFGASAGELSLPVKANAKTDKPDHQQDGSGYHHPIPMFHR